MTRSSELSGSFRSQSCPDPDADFQTIKKRQRTPHVNEVTLVVTRGRRSRGRPRIANKSPLTTTHEIRMLRAQVSSMEEELRTLQSKWTSQLPDERVLAVAQDSACVKREVNQAEHAHNELEHIRLQQQLMFATLQSAMLRAPLHSSGEEILKALHFDTHLGRGPEEREKKLLAHSERSLNSVPSILNRFSKLAVDKVLQNRGERAVPAPVTPLSLIDIAGYKGCTLVTGVFMSEIPHTSLEEVYEAVLAYFENMPTSMKRHLGVNVKRTRLSNPDSPAAYYRLSFDGAGLPATVNHVVCTELTPSHGVVHMDAITDDPLHPVPTASPVEYGICGLSITPRKELETGRTASMTLRWVVLYRYNLLPSDLILKNDLEVIRPILNGDLITASVCKYIQEKQQSPRAGH
ncbi:hypothetical protein PHYPSEUDO_007626 [Phytophthora pseudosyringae]|uniref:START domain-containing protein n=1 Tax=Phytophthora pseudosyringae TaxID=221518 RepID=A0A8T1VLD9_9STRA|nr:hypothetical protein PHYPSEUDO_007626 [Phytophthora pseudosyringae]